MLMYNLLEYNDNYSMKSGSLWNYYVDEVNNDANKNNDAANYRINNNKTTTTKSFEYKSKIIGNKPDNNSRLDAEVVVLLKYLNNFWRSLHLPLINCEIELDLPRSKYSIICDILRTPEVAGDNLVEATLTNGATFQINNAKLYVPIVTLSINDNINF